jgi:hypothetical protein
MKFPCRTKALRITWPKNGPSLSPGPIGQHEQARAELSTAIEMYQAMTMTFWLPQTEASGHQSDCYIWRYVKPDWQTLAEAISKLE